VDNLRCPGHEGVDDKDQLLLAKYYFAGGCARWMFEFSFNTFRMDFDMHLEQVGYYSSLWVAFISLNHLRGLTVVKNGKILLKKYFFVSQYAVEKLAKKCNDTRHFIVVSYKWANAANNLAFVDWIFEFDVDYQLSIAHKNNSPLCLVADGNGNVNFPLRVDNYVVLQSMESLCDAIKSLATNKVLWVKPKLWHQKAYYDFLCFWKDVNEDETKLNMVVVNTTVAQTHSLNLSVVQSLATELTHLGCAVEAIRFDFIIPKDGGAVFHVGNIIGNLRGWRTLTGDQWPTNGYNDDTLCVRRLTKTDSV
jgi:hypothetical protein